MGSFNLSCIASRQTIATDDPCYLVVIARVNSYRAVPLSRNGKDLGAFHGISDSNCYPDGSWSSSSGLIQGVYEDGGRFVLDQGESNLALVVKVLSDLVDDGLCAQSDERNVEPFDLQQIVSDELKSVISSRAAQLPGFAFSDAQIEQITEAWECVWEAMQEGRLFALRMGVPTPVAVAALHRSAGQKLMALREGQRDWSNQPYGRTKVFDRAILAGVEQAKSMAQHMKQEHPESVPVIDRLDRLINELDTTGSLADSSVTARPISDLDAHELSCRASCAMAFDNGFMSELRRIGDGSNSGTPLTRQANYQIGQLFRGKISPDECFQRLQPTFDYLALLGGMESLNLKFEPSTYAGQDYSNDIGETYARFVADVSNVVCEMRREDEDERDQGQFEHDRPRRG